MNNSIIEQNFINWCYELNPYINPYIFIRQYRSYSEELLPLIESDSTAMHNAIHTKKPNINFSFKGRIKAKRSTLIKNFVNIAENIESIFSNEIDPSKREKAFARYFKFLLKDDPEKYNEIKKMISGLVPTFDNYQESFSVIFNKLSQEEKDTLITRLGRTEDTYAYRPIVHSVDFPIKSIISSDSQFYIEDEDENMIPINPAIILNPNKDIIYSKEDNSKNIFMDGKKISLTERNLLYPNELPSSKRTFENAQKDIDGNLTLLCDSLVLDDNSVLDIVDIHVNPRTTSIMITDSNGEQRNLSRLLQKETVKLQKHDEETSIEAVYDIYDIIQEYYNTHNIQSIKSRYKDYIANRKPSGYGSIHDSAFNKTYGYSLESQSRTLKMEDDCKDESSAIGHDAYKEEKFKKLYKNKILHKILEKDSLAFDSSTSTLMKMLENPNVELSELLGKYILTTSMNGVSVSYQPTIDVIFEHTFFNTKPSLDSPSDNLPKLDFSSYENFVASRIKRNNAILKQNDGPDFYDD